MANEMDVEDLRAFVSRRPSVRRDRTGGQEPLSVDAIGDTREFWGATGAVASGGEVTLYLTNDRTVGGGSVFSMLPSVEVYYDEGRSAGGFGRAGMPLTPSDAMVLVPHTGYKVKWVVGNEVWAVVVTNSTGGVAGFQIHAKGV